MQSIVSLYPIKPWTHVMCPHHTEKGGQVVIACHASRGGERTWFMDQLGCYGPAASIVVLPSRHAKGNDDPVNYVRIVASSPEASQSMERSHLWWQQDPGPHWDKSWCQFKHSDRSRRWDGKEGGFELGR